MFNYDRMQAERGKTALIRATNLSVERQGQRLLKEISLAITKAEITIILGHNGAGKTLLMRTLHGLIAPSKGQIEAPPRSSQKMVFQKPVMLRRSASNHFDFLCPRLPQNVKYEWFEKAGLSGQFHTPARLLSGGEQQKLALIGALASTPKLLFLDEPTANLDFEATAFVEDILSWSKAQGTTIIMASHNRAQAERLADTVLLMESGQLREHTAAHQFFKSPQTDAGKAYLSFA